MNNPLTCNFGLDRSKYDAAKASYAKIIVPNAETDAALIRDADALLARCDEDLLSGLFRRHRKSGIGKAEERERGDIDDATNITGLKKMRAIAEKLQDRLGYPPRMMPTDRAAAYIGFGSTKFLEMVEDGRMPKPIDVDGNTRWDRLELDDAVENLKDRRRDPVTRDRDRLEQRIHAMEGKA